MLERPSKKFLSLDSRAKVTEVTEESYYLPALPRRNLSYEPCVTSVIMLLQGIYSAASCLGCRSFRPMYPRMDLVGWCVATLRRNCAAKSCEVPTGWSLDNTYDLQDSHKFLEELHKGVQ